MNQWEPIFLFAVLCGLLMIPLGYALRTLLGMQSKSIYPLLRTKELDGRLETVVVTSGR